MKLGLAARLEACQLLTAGMVPGEKLPGSGVVLSRVEILEKRRSGEPARSQIEDEVHQSVELSLRKRNLDQTLDGSFGIANILGQNRLSQRQTYSAWIVLIR